MKVLAKSEFFEIDFHEELRDIQPHGEVSQHGGRRDDNDIQKQVIRLFHEQKHQDDAGQLADRILGHRIFELFHPGEEPGDIEHRGQKSHCQYQIDHFVLIREGNEGKPDRNAGR